MRHPNKPKPMSELEFIEKVESLFDELKVERTEFFKSYAWYIDPLQMSVHKKQRESYYSIIRNGHEVTRKPTFECILDYIHKVQREMTMGILRNKHDPR